MKTLQILSIALLLFIAFGALIGGFSLISDPSGDTTGFKLEWLSNSPFHNFFIPGLILFAIGAFSTVVAVLAMMKSKISPLLEIVDGIIICIWIVTQLFIFGENSSLQPTILFIGMMLIILGYYQLRRNKVARLI